MVLLLPVFCQVLSTIPRAAVLKLKHAWESPGGLVKTPTDEPYPQSSSPSRSERAPRMCISTKSPIDADASNMMTLWKYCSSESHTSFSCLFPHVDYFCELLIDFLIGSLFFLAYLKKQVKRPKTQVWSCYFPTLKLSAFSLIPLEFIWTS